MVAFNKSDEPQKLEMERFAEVIGDEARGTDVVNGHRYSFKNLTIPARDVLVLDLN
ncbi:cyclomaltodextrinase C-terminal domain-containing protein [Microbulbifer rhizosphaerae]|uniref:cyclomaltodextrinase C-terminal domain-containing protein n=1 Tax=Microbulbifer rhizosphaerae TaxID=1562603 RepID=UPI003CCE415E